jgi:hypothetical protein
MKLTKTAITLEKVGYNLTGTVLLALWGGGEGTYPINTMRISDTQLTALQHAKTMADAAPFIHEGMGAKAYLGVHFEVATLFEHGFTLSDSDPIYIGKAFEELEDD